MSEMVYRLWQIIPGIFGVTYFLENNGHKLPGIIICDTAPLQEKHTRVKPLFRDSPKRDSVLIMLCTKDKSEVIKD